MIAQRIIRTKKGNAIGVNITMPGSEHDDFLLITADKGFIMCGYINMEAAEKMKDVAVLVGAHDLDGTLKEAVRAVTSRAADLGIKVGMTGLEALELLMN